MRAGAGLSDGPDIEVRMLGGLEVVIAGSPVAVARPKIGALLAMLALQPNHVVSSDRLIDGLWGDAIPGGATATLQSYVSMLRSLVDRGVHADGVAEPRRLVSRKPGYLLAVDPQAVDALHFETLVVLGAADAAAGNEEVAATSLRRALGLWRGAALVDLAFAPFAGPQIARLDELRLSAYETCIACELALGRHHQLIPEIDALVAANPLREQLRAHQMLALYRCDRQADALRAFGELRTVLADQLGLDPSPALRRLEGRILAQSGDLELRARSVATRTPALPTRRSSERGDVAPPSPLVGVPIVVPFPSALPPAGSPTVGRRAEKDTLDMRAGASAEGVRLLELIVGPAGIGKSHLAAVFTRGRAAGGATVLFGGCSETPGLLYAPFTEALRSAVGDADGGSLRALLGEQAADLALLLPELHARFALLPSPPARRDPTTDADLRRHLIFDAVAIVLERLAQRAPVILVIDDLHWADESTAALVEHLVRRPTPSALMIVATVRPGWPADGPIGRVIAGLDRIGAVHATPLGGLSADDVAVLVRQHRGVFDDANADGGADRRVSGADASLASDTRSTVAMVTERSDGNPFFVLELLRHVDRDPTAGSAALPPRILELLQQRLRRLRPTTLRVLETAALIGKHFDLELCQTADARNNDERAVLDALDEAVQAQIVLELPKAYGRYEFTQDLIIDAVLAGMSNNARRLGHRDVARAVEALPLNDPARVNALARHWIDAGAAGDLSRAVAAATVAGEAAETVAAWAEAARWYEQALAALDDAPFGDSAVVARTRADLLIRIHTTIWSATDADVEPGSLAEAIDLARSLDDPALFCDAVLASVLTTSRPETVRHVEVLEEAIARLDRAVVAGDAGRRAIDSLRVRIQSALAESLAFSDRGDAAVEVARAALTGARTLGDSALLGEVVSQLIAELPPWATAERQELVSELAGAVRNDDPLRRMRMHHLDALVALERGEIGRFVESTDAHSRLAEVFGKQRSRAGAAQKAALGVFLAGHLDDAAGEAMRVLDISRHGTFQQGQLAQLVTIERERDALGPYLPIAADTLEKSCAVIASTGRLEGQFPVAATAALVLLDGGDVAGVRQALATCRPVDVGRTAKNFMYAFGLAVLAELAARSGTDGEVEALLPMVAMCRGRHASMLGITTVGSVDRVYAMLLARRGDEEGCRSAFAAAIADHDRGGSPVLRARVRIDAARSFDALGLRSEAVGHLDDAAPLIERHRLVRLAAEASRLCASA